MRGVKKQVKSELAAMQRRESGAMFALIHAAWIPGEGVGGAQLVWNAQREGKERKEMEAVTARHVEEGQWEILIVHRRWW